MGAGALPAATHEPHRSYVLERRQVLAGSLEEVFSFFEDPRNLEAITPPWLRFEVRATTNERVRLGTVIDYRLRWQGLPVRWRSRISEYERGVMFADEMLVGPYRRWYHRHRFRQVASGVEMVDTVDYELPLGVLGRLTHAALIRTQLERIFDHRRDTIGRIFGAE